MLTLVQQPVDVMAMSLIFLTFPSCLLPHFCKMDAASPDTTSAFKVGREGRGKEGRQAGRKEGRKEGWEGGREGGREGRTGGREGRKEGRKGGRGREGGRKKGKKKKKRKKKLG